MELSPNEEPVWTYFDAQHRYILDQMQEVFTSAVAVVKSDTAIVIMSKLLTHFPVQPCTKGRQRKLLRKMNSRRLSHPS